MTINTQDTDYSRGIEMSVNYHPSSGVISKCSCSIYTVNNEQKMILIIMKKLTAAIFF